MTAAHPPRRASLGPWLVNGLVGMAGVVAWGLSSTSATPAAQVTLFAVAAICLLAALRRHLAVASIVLGVLALGLHHAHLETIDGWAAVSIGATAAGLWHALRRWPGLRWTAASLPFWAFSSAAGWCTFAALALTIGGLMVGAVGPVLPGRRRRFSGEPVPALAAGPLVSVAPQAFGSRASRVPLYVAGAVLALSLVLGGASSASDDPATFGGLATGTLIIALTIAFTGWFAGRGRIRVDQEGIHARVMFGEHSVLWRDVCGLRLRTVYMPGMGLRMHFYSVQGPTTEVSIHGRMPGADELRRTVEAATGLRWPTPDVDANF